MKPTATDKLNHRMLDRDTTPKRLSTNAVATGIFIRRSFVKFIQSNGYNGAIEHTPVFVHKVMQGAQVLATADTLGSACTAANELAGNNE